MENKKLCTTEELKKFPSENIKMCTTEVLKKFPKVRTKDYEKIAMVGNELYCISNMGRIIRVKHCIVWTCRRKKKVWHNMEVLDHQLIDEGIREEEKII